MGPLFFSSFFNELNSGSHVSVGTTHGDVQVWEATICKQVCSMAGHPACVGEFLSFTYIVFFHDTVFSVLTLFENFINIKYLPRYHGMEQYTFCFRKS